MGCKEIHGFPFFFLLLSSFSSLFFNYNQYMRYYFGFSFGVESADCLTEIGVPFGKYYFAASLENCMVWFCVSSLCRDENGFLNFFSFFPFHLFHIKACFVLLFHVSSCSSLLLLIFFSLSFTLSINTTRKYMRWWGATGLFCVFLSFSKPIISLLMKLGSFIFGADRAMGFSLL